MQGMAVTAVPPESGARSDATVPFMPRLSPDEGKVRWSPFQYRDLPWSPAEPVQSRLPWPEPPRETGDSE